MAKIGPFKVNTFNIWNCNRNTAILVNMRGKSCLYDMRFHGYSIFHIFRAIIWPFWPKLAILGWKFYYDHLNTQNHTRNLVILVNMIGKSCSYDMWFHRYRSFTDLALQIIPTLCNIHMKILKSGRELNFYHFSKISKGWCSEYIKFSYFWHPEWFCR